MKQSLEDNLAFVCIAVCFHIQGFTKGGQQSQQPLPTVSGKAASFSNSTAKRARRGAASVLMEKQEARERLVGSGTPPVGSPPPSVGGKWETVRARSTPQVQQKESEGAWARSSNGKEQGRRQSEAGRQGLVRRQSEAGRQGSVQWKEQDGGRQASVHWGDNRVSSLEQQQGAGSGHILGTEAWDSQSSALLRSLSGLLPSSRLSRRKGREDVVCLSSDSGSGRETGVCVNWCMCGFPKIGLKTCLSCLCFTYCSCPRTRCNIHRVWMKCCPNHIVNNIERMLLCFLSLHRCQVARPRRRQLEPGKRTAQRVSS